MQEGPSKIDQAISKHQGWLRDELITAVTLSKNYADPSEWLTANRDAVEKKLELSRQETSGENWQHLQAQVRAVLTGTFVRPAVTEIKWGDKPQTQKIEFGAAYEISKLSEKIALLKTLLAHHSSEGKACVPTVYAYMQILGEKIVNPAAQQARLEQILSRWRREFNSAWIFAHQLTNSLSGVEIIPEFGEQLRSHTGLDSLDTVLNFWELKENRAVFSRSPDRPGLSLAKRSERSAIISTVAPLTGTVISAEVSNPFWQLPDWRGKAPRPGDRFTSAGSHSMLVVECSLSPDGDQKKAKFTLIDPQTGTVFQLTAQAIYDANWRNFSRRYASMAEAQSKKAYFQTEFSCGTCWVGKTD